MQLDKVNENLSLLRTALPLCSDSYLLYAYIPENKKVRAAEFGAGGGVISMLCMAKGKFSHIDAYEIQDDIAKTAVENVKMNSLEDKIDVICGDIRDIPASVYYDVIFFNPPYYATDSGKSCDDPKRMASFYEMNGSVADFCTIAKKHLNFGGMVYAVYPANRVAFLINSMMSAQIMPKTLTFIHPTASKPASLVLVGGKYGGKDGIVVSKPLIIYKKEGTSLPCDYTDDMRIIYENGDFNEFHKKFR